MDKPCPKWMYWIGKLFRIPRHEIEDLWNAVYNE